MSDLAMLNAARQRHAEVLAKVLSSIEDARESRLRAQDLCARATRALAAGEREVAIAERLQLMLKASD